MKTILEVLGESSLRAMIIALTTASVLRVLRVKSPGICHHAWTGVLMAMLCLPFFSLWAPRIAIPVLPASSTPAAERLQANVPSIPATETAAPEVLTLPKSSAQSGITNQTPPKMSIYQIAGILYLAGFCVLAFKLLAGTLLSQRLGYGASRDGQILYSMKCTVPITVGLFRARVFLPAESKDWDPDKLGAVLIHEKEHARRRDPLVEWLALLNRSLYWFHPLSWWLCSKVSGLAEQTCDEAVLAQGYDGSTYAEHLLDFARSVKRRGSLITVWGSSLHGSKLANRIRRILTSGKSPAISRVRLAVVTVLCGISILAPSVCELARAQMTPLRTPVIPLPASGMISPYAAALDHQVDQSAPSKNEPKLDSLSAAPEQELNEIGTGYLKQGQYIKARLAFQTLINTYPDIKLAADAMMAIGDSFYEEGGAENMSRALEQYKNVAVFFPSDPKTTDMLMKIILIAKGNARSSDANTLIWTDGYIDTFLRNHPDSDFAPVVRRIQEEVSQEFARLRLSRITGYVVDPSGKPLEGVAVVPTLSEPFQQTAYTNAQGYFVISGVPLDQQKVELRFLKNGFSAAAYDGANPHGDPLRIMMNMAPVPSVESTNILNEKGSDSFQDIEKRFFNMKMMPSHYPDRNPQYSIKTLEAIMRFLEANSDSDHAPIINRYKVDVEENLALGDLRVAQFYAGKGNYAGAIYRLKNIIDHYPDFTLIDEVNRLYKAMSTAKQPQ
jgi:beta-lactamase regulating signal transducer with metallopeptidase domain/outer membrane protein assembly factor BamD (BamD/ComL family)